MDKWKALDTNGDGEIDPDEFYQGMSDKFKDLFAHEGEDDDEEDFDYVFNQLKEEMSKEYSGKGFSEEGFDRFFKYAVLRFMIKRQQFQDRRGEEWDIDAKEFRNELKQLNEEYKAKYMDDG